MMHNNRVVITGMGIVSSYGSTVESFWQGIRNGVSAVRPWQPSEVTGFPITYAAPVDLDDAVVDAVRRDFRPGLDRRGIFGAEASRRAIADSNAADGLATGVCVCSGVPDIIDEDLCLMTGNHVEEATAHLAGRRNDLNVLSGLRCGNDAMAQAIAEYVRADGPVLNINGACAGASQAIGLAFHCIRRGEAERMVAGGADSVLNIRTMTGLYLLGATSVSLKFGDKLCRPFDKDRSGLVAAEGGAMLVLESETSARKRDARIYGEILGYGSSLDAYKVTAPHPEGRGAVLSMTRALDDADLAPESIGYINAHGTSTPLNDVIETAAIKQVFPHAVSGGLSISSTKSMIGHWIAACGAPEAIATVLAIRHKELPPTIHLQSPDPQCDLDYVPNRFKPQPVDYAMSNSFGFGGINASLIFGRYS